MERILAGIETEYGLDIEGIGPADMVLAVTEFVRTCPIGRRGWDYRPEAPRADIRGFTAEKLSVDPEDAKFDAETHVPPDGDVRSDSVLPNGGRLYNDHGHPEFATPECFSIRELALHDMAGAQLIRQMARDYAQKTGRATKAFKNNTDYHGASYGTHESYLVPRSVGWQAVHAWLSPLLAVRGFLCGAGKAGTENGKGPAFQLTQRADFFTQPIGVDTLFNRPLFNTRDEPHADPADWMRVHVIAGDANPTFVATARKIALAKIALSLAIRGEKPPFELKDPVAAFRATSRDPSGDAKIELTSGSWTTPRSILDSYLGAGCLALADHEDPELGHFLQEAIDTLHSFETDTEKFARNVEWAAKKWVLDTFAESGGAQLGSTEMQAYDLAFHDLDPEDNLFAALQMEGQFSPDPDPAKLAPRLQAHSETTRGWVRGLAVMQFPEAVQTVGWRYLVMKAESRTVQVDLLPDKTYPPQLTSCLNVESFVQTLEQAGIPCQTID